MAGNNSITRIDLYYIEYLNKKAIKICQIIILQLKTILIFAPRYR